MVLVSDIFAVITRLHANVFPPLLENVGGRKNSFKFRIRNLTLFYTWET